MDPASVPSGSALLEAGDFRGAAARFEQELRAQPESYSAWYNLGLALYKASELDRARQALEHARSLRPQQAEASLNLARVEIDAGDLDRARELAAAFPDHAPGQVLLGHIEEMRGARDSATACFERALQIEPATVGAWCGLVRMRRPFDADRLEALVETGQFGRSEESSLRYALAQHFDQEGQAARAFGHAARANALRRSRFDPARHRELVDGLIGAQIPATSTSDLAPIFLVGAPRTGSSLLERILEGHPATAAYGERPDVGLIAQSIGYPASAPQLTTAALDALAQRYVDGLGTLPAGVTRPIEKTPSNVLVVGLLAAMFPRASFVYLARDPRDVAISNFLLDFGDHRVSCSTSIENLGAFLAETERLGRHWEQDSGLRVRRQVYEELVGDPEGQLGELLAFLELPWHADCLRFADRDAPCRTASSQQVREPLNRRGIGRWKAYAPFLTGWLKGIPDPAEEPSEPPPPMASPKHTEPSSSTPALKVQEARERASAGDPEAAVELLVQVIGQRRDLPQAWWTLGQVLEPLGRWTEASRAYEQAARLQPSDATFQRDHGRALVKVGRHGEAARCLRRATNLAPDSAECHDLLGVAYHALGRRSLARAAYRKAIELDPQRASAYHHLGLLLAELGEMPPAIEHLRQATELAPERPVYHRELARASLRGKDVGLARRAASRALEHDPDDPVAHLVMGWTLEMAGNRPASVASYRRALELDPHQSGPYYKLARLGELEDLTGIERELERPGRSSLERSELYFAQAEILNRRDQTDLAWDAWTRGNAENASAIAYDRAEHRELVDRIIRSTPAELFRSRPGMGDANRLPTFIVGMPRSGTSLVEQLLALHPEVLPLGEHGGIHELGSTLRRYGHGRREYPEGLADLERAGAVRMAAQYLRSFEMPAGEVERVVDKAPGNFHYLGLIALILPNARIVHVKRDPRDTCVSNWTTNFGQQRCVFASDLDDLAGYYEDYQRLMEHWTRVLPLQVHEIEYEAFVADPEGQARELHRFLELRWDPACLDFHRSDRDVLTASAMQVRQPVHGRSVGRWRRFEAHLGPLLRLRP